MRRSLRITLALVALGVLASSFYAASRVAERGRFATPYSSYGAGPHGTRALLLLARALGHDAQPFTRELSHLPQGTLVLLQGCRGALVRKVARPERDALAAWVERGGLLIVAGTAEPLPDGAGLYVAEAATCKPDAERGLLERMLVSEPRQSGLDARLSPRLSAEAAGAPLTHLLPFEVDEPLTLRMGHDSQATELLSSDEGTLALTTPLGRGRIVLLGIPEALTNHALSNGGGQVFARLLRAFAPRGPVLFDEYHLGMGERRSLVGYLRDAGYSGVLLQLLGVAVAALLAQAARIAPVRDNAGAPRRTRPFTAALADLLAQSGDERGIRERLANHALARIAHHYHARSLPRDALARWLSAQGLFAVAGYVQRIEGHAREPLAPGESVLQRAQAIERDETAAIVLGEAR